MNLNLEPTRYESIEGEYAYTFMKTNKGWVIARRSKDAPPIPPLTRHYTVDGVWELSIKSYGDVQYFDTIEQAVSVVGDTK